MSETEKRKGRKPVAEKRNGVTCPVDQESVTGRLWILFERVTQENHEGDRSKVTTEQVSRLPESKDVPLATIRAQFSRWRRFHGLIPARGGEAE